MTLPTSLALALASSAATLVETLAFNTLTVWRTRVQAGQAKANVGWFHAVPIQLACLLARRPMTLILATALAAIGWHPFLAGCLAGLVEGVVFTPTRRLSTVQLASTARTSIREVLRTIVREEGWGGLWLGWRVNAVRTALGAGVYFGAVAAAVASLPAAGHFIHGAIASATATLVLNPFEVILATRYVKRTSPETLNTLVRGLLLSLARNVPGGALRWWLTQVGVKMLTHLGTS